MNARTDYAPSGTTRRCLLPADGGCGRVWPSREFRRRRADGSWLDRHHELCAECRGLVPVVEEARARYESGADAAEVAGVLDLSRSSRLYEVAARHGWDKDARRRAQLAGDGLTCCRASCDQPRAPGKDRCRAHEKKRAALQALKERQRAATRAPLPYQCTTTGCYRRRVADSDYCEGHTRQRRRLAEQSADRLRVAPVAYRATGSVTIRCHVCGLHRVTALAAPEPCSRCGTSGAAPVGPWDESMGEQAEAA